MSTPCIAFIGAGNMAASLIGGLRAQGVPAAQIRASDPGAEQRAKIAGEFAIDVVESNAEAVADADVVVLSVKPQAMKAVCQALAPALKPEQLIVSIAAGIPAPASKPGSASRARWSAACPTPRRCCARAPAGCTPTRRSAPRNASRPGSCCPRWASPCGWTTKRRSTR